MLPHQLEVKPIHITILTLNQVFSQHQLIIILPIRRNLLPPISYLEVIQSHLYPNTSQSVSPCGRRKERQRRSVTVISIFMSTNLAAIVSTSLMLLHFCKTSSKTCLFVLIILLCLTTKVSCLRDSRPRNDGTMGATGVDSESSLIFDGKQKMDFCYDVEGERHGLFSSWEDSSTGCQCSCQSVGNLLVSVCEDDCGSNEDSYSLLSQNDEPSATLVYGDPSKQHTKGQSHPTKSELLLINYLYLIYVHLVL